MCSESSKKEQTQWTVSVEDLAFFFQDEEFLRVSPEPEPEPPRPEPRSAICIFLMADQEETIVLVHFY